jgi:tRNA 2-selenouridine synthase
MLLSDAILFEIKIGCLTLPNAILQSCFCKVWFMQRISPEEFLKLKKTIPIVDVRSPGEFVEGHIPFAISLPIFDDAERAIIKKKKKKKGRIPAIEKGLEIVGPKMAGFVRDAGKLAVSGQLLIHCWRGGMRSESMAWLYERIGIHCFTLDGGYKAYRNYLLETIGSIQQLIVIEGLTGSGKTGILLSLKAMGEQVIDLEGIANHKGSVFGGIGQQAQPSTQQFQNNLFDEVLQLDLSKRVWVEGESQTVGRVFIPDPFWHNMNNARNIEIEVPRTDRIKRLVDEYGQLSPDLMENSIRSLTKRLGDQRMNEILQLYTLQDFAAVADRLLEYYDQTYLFSREKYKKKYQMIVLPNGNVEENARIILKEIDGDAIEIK